MAINPKLQSYIETQILPQYSKNEPGHGINHINYVIKRSLFFAKQVPDINYDMVYTTAAYHDLGHHIDAEHHEIVSSQLLSQDQNLQQFFTTEQIHTIAEAIRDHRSLQNTKPHTVYGKIVASADNRTDVNDALRSTYLYRRTHYPELSLPEIIEDSRRHLLTKFGPNGYSTTRNYFNDPEFQNFIQDITALAKDPTAFKKRYLKANHLT